jgi:hypothetical protein
VLDIHSRIVVRRWRITITFPDFALHGVGLKLPSRIGKCCVRGEADGITLSVKSSA